MSFGAFINLIQSSAKDFGGQCTFRFSQSLAPVSVHLDKHGGTDGGICQALSTKWMVEHSKDGSLWPWLYPGGNLSTSALYNVMINFLDPGIQGIGQMTQSDRYLNMHGLVMRRNIVTGDAMDKWSRTSGSGGGAGHIGRRIASAIRKTHKNTSGNYVLLGMDGNGGHAMCAWIAQDAAFFDPNCGEFWFEKVENFFNWLPLLTRLMDYDSEFWEAQAVAYARKM